MCLFVLNGCDRGVSERLSDMQMDLTLKRKLYHVDPNLELEVSRDVYRGDVLLTGHVGSLDRKEKAESLARSVEGVHNVYNHLLAIKGSRFLDYTRDAGITQEIKTHWLFDSDVSSSRFYIRTSDGIVYLMGITKNQEERNKVVDYARNVQGVKKVVCYIKLGQSS